MFEKLLFRSLAAIAAAALSSTTAQAVTFDWATVANPGNADDIHGDGYGGVDYTYRISQHEVTNAQYTDFLNAVAATDTNALYSTAMGSDTRGGITRSGSSGSYTYAVKPDSIGNGPGGADGNEYTYGNKPVVFVSFSDTMRFANWLENGQPTGAQDASTTEDGAYAISDGLSEIRDPGARYFVPSEDEWYKAAYYDPSSSVYYDYATSTDSLPNNNLPSADTGNSANFWDSGYTTGNDSFPMTNVGAYTLSESPFDTFDQGGNVWEWNEAVIDSFDRGLLRGLRGGDWFSVSDGLRASDRLYDLTTSEGPTIGFRVASIPEPSTTLLGALASVGVVFRKRRISKQKETRL